MDSENKVDGRKANGGKREGAGRPAKEETKPLYVRLPLTMHDRIDKTGLSPKQLIELALICIDDAKKRGEK